MSKPTAKQIAMTVGVMQAYLSHAWCVWSFRGGNERDETSAEPLGDYFASLLSQCDLSSWTGIERLQFLTSEAAASVLVHGPLVTAKRHEGN